MIPKTVTVREKRAYLKTTQEGFAKEVSYSVNFCYVRGDVEVSREQFDSIEFGKDYRFIPEPDDAIGTKGER